MFRGHFKTVDGLRMNSSTAFLSCHVIWIRAFCTEETVRQRLEINQAASAERSKPGNS